MSGWVSCMASKVDTEDKFILKRVNLEHILLPKQENLQRFLQSTTEGKFHFGALLGGFLIGGNNLLNDLAKDAKFAISKKILPKIVDEGCSGTYQVFDKHQNVIAIFKPSDEHPYSNRNPKWLPFILQKISPLSFYNGCRLPDQSYLAEAGAYIVDRDLGLGVVPPTGVVKLNSPSFSCGFNSGWAKTGSFQLYVNGYMSAKDFYDKEYQLLSEEEHALFQEEFERFVILDYVIRNTDRHLKNWLVKYYPHAINSRLFDSDKNQTHDVSLDDFEGIRKPGKILIKVAAIDNGLAFPKSHSDYMRKYLYGWIHCPNAQKQFSLKTVHQFLPKLEGPEGFNEDLVEGIIHKLRILFLLHPSFNKETFNSQSSVVRGQILNVVRALKNGLTPKQMALLPPVAVGVSKSFDGQAVYAQRIVHENPCFNFL